MSRRSVALLAAVMFSAMALFGSSATASGTGSFGTPISENNDFNLAAPKTTSESTRYPPAVSVGVMPDGRVIYWGGLEGLEDSKYPLPANAAAAFIKSRVRVLDLRTGSPTWWKSTDAAQEFGLGDDMFCADVRLLPDGRIIATGGTNWKNDPIDLTPYGGDGDALPSGTVELFGSNHTRIFDPATNLWTKVGNMNFGRWYPGLITQADGNMFAAGGVGRLLYNSSGFNVNQSETFSTATNTWSVNDADNDGSNGYTGDSPMPLFPRLHLMPDGKVLFTANAQMWGPFGQTLDEAMWNIHKTYDPATKTWTLLGPAALGARSGALSVMLTLKAPYTSAQIVQAGGTLGTSPGSLLANNITQVLNYDAASGSISSAMSGPLNNNRWYSSGVLLPDGQVFAVNGADKDEVIFAGGDYPVRQAEIFDPATGTWTALASTSRDRTYHNSAVLLPDATVLVGGHSPINTFYAGNNGQDPTSNDPDAKMNNLNAFHDSLGTSNNFKDPSFEIYSPPYLSAGPRPTITGVQKGIAWGSTFDVATGMTGGKLVLVHMPTATHVTDADMRAIELPSAPNGSGGLTATAPPSGTIAPPGYYYLFAVSSAGVPSKAYVVKVGSTNDFGAALAPFGA